MFEDLQRVATRPDRGAGRWALWVQCGLAVAVAVIALAVYLLTLAPGLTFEHWGTDGGDLIAAARTLGVPHPSGYPTYMLLAWAFSHLPLGTVAYRVNLLSAICAACAVGLICAAGQLALPPSRHRLPLAAAAGLALAFSPLFWSQAVISEVYALLALFAAALLWLLFLWRAGGSDAALCLAALLLGLGLGSHLTLVFAVPAVASLLSSTRTPSGQSRLRSRTVLLAAGLFFAALGIYAYLPLAAAQRPPVNWGNPSTWDRFVWVVTGRVYQNLVFGLEMAAIPARLSEWARLAGRQFGWWGFFICLVGALGWWRRDRQFVIFSLVWTLPLAAYAFLYDTYDSQVYLLPALLLLALCWGAGAHHLLIAGNRLPVVWQRLALVVVCALPFVPLALNWQQTDLSDDRSAHNYMEQALDAVAPGGLVVVRGDRPTFALWYGLYGEGRRPDVAVVSGPLLAFYWYRDNIRHLYPDLVLKPPPDGDVTTDDLVRALIVDNAGHRPVFATDPGEAWKTWFRFIPEGEAPVYRVEIKGTLGRLECSRVPSAPLPTLAIGRACPAPQVGLRAAAYGPKTV